MGKKRFKQNPKTGRMEGAYGGPGETPPSAPVRLPPEASEAWNAQRSPTLVAVSDGAPSRVSERAQELWKDSDPRGGMLTGLGSSSVDDEQRDIELALYGTPVQQIAANFRLEGVQGDYVVDEENSRVTMGRATVRWDEERNEFVVTGRSRIRPPSGGEFVVGEKEALSTTSVSEAVIAAQDVASGGVDGYRLISQLHDKDVDYDVFDGENRVSLADGATSIEWSPDSASGYVVTTLTQTRAATYWEPAEFREDEVLCTDDPDEAVDAATSVGYDGFEDDYDDTDWGFGDY